MLVWLFSLLGTALLAGLHSPALASDLDIARGRAALQREAIVEARDLALLALADDPGSIEAQQLYVDAASAAGFGSRALQEIASLPAQPAPWTAAGEALRLAIAEGESKRIKAAFKRLFDEHPDHPELLAPIWDLSSAQARLWQLRIRRRHLGSKARADADLVQLYRMRQLADAVDRSDWVAPIDAVLEERGETPLPTRPPLDRLGRTRYAEQLVNDDDLPLRGYPSELVDVLDRASQMLFKGGRYARVVELCEQLQALSGAPEAWAVEADAWRRAGELERARQAARQAIARAADPIGPDLAASNDERLRNTLSRAFLVSALVHEAAGDIAEAQIDLALAHLFARRVLDDHLAKRIAKARRTLDVGLRARFAGQGDPSARALTAARRADDPAAVLRHVRDALLLTTMGSDGSLRVARDPDLYAGSFARPILTRSRALVEQGELRSGRTYAVVATLLEPDPFWWAERAGLQQQLGEDDAAFVSYARARSRGVPELDALLEQTFTGFGDWQTAARHEGGAGDAPPVASDPSAAAPSDAVATEPLPRAATGPELGKPLPSFVIPTREGRLDSTFLRGRIVVLSFFDADCDACLQMLPQLGTVARRLRDRGLDAVVIAVSLDEEPEDYEQVAHLGGRWGEVVHQPDLGERFGVVRLPTTWLVDQSGIARFYFDHPISGDELLDYIGQIR